MKKFKITPMKLAIVLFILCSVTTGVYSFMLKQTQPIHNEFVKAHVDCEITKTPNSGDIDSITVTNTGNIDAYIRVRFSSHWVDNNGNIVAKESVYPTFTYDESKWIKKGQTYYYKNPVDVLKTTDELLGSKIELLQEDGYKQVVEVFAEAIQFKPSEAVQTSWHVVVEDGVITSVN